MKVIFFRIYYEKQGQCYLKYYQHYSRDSQPLVCRDGDKNKRKEVLHLYGLEQPATNFVVSSCEKVLDKEFLRLCFRLKM